MATSADRPFTRMAHSFHFFQRFPVTIQGPTIHSVLRFSGRPLILRCNWGVKKHSAHIKEEDIVIFM